MRGAIIFLQLGMNFLTKATIPKNDCKLVMLVGWVKLVMAFIFARVGLYALTTDYVSKEVRLIWWNLHL